MKSKGQHLRFYEEISEIARNLEQDPFTSQDIEEMTDQSYNFIGKALSEASEKEEHEIEKFGIEYGPNAYSFEGKIDDEQHLRHVEDLYLSNEAIEKFVEEEEIEAKKLETFLSQRLDEMGTSKVSQLERTGYILEHLKERGDLEYTEQTDTYQVLE